MKLSVKNRVHQRPKQKNNQSASAKRRFLLVVGGITGAIVALLCLLLVEPEGCSGLDHFVFYLAISLLPSALLLLLWCVIRYLRSIRCERVSLLSPCEDSL